MLTHPDHRRVLLALKASDQSRSFTCKVYLVRLKRRFNQELLRAKAAEHQQQIVIGIPFMNLQTASDLFHEKPDQVRLELNIS